MTFGRSWLLCVSSPYSAYIRSYRAAFASQLSLLFLIPRPSAVNPILLPQVPPSP